MEFIAVDVETTGTLSHVDHIVELAAVRFKDGQAAGQYSSLVNPLCPMPEEASRVNGITDDMLKNQPEVKEVLKPFSSFCASTCLVAHNAVFDFQFLAAAMEKHACASPPLGPMLDTYSLSKALLPGLSNYKLSTLAEYFKISSEGFHRAGQDAWTCGKIFEQLLIKIKIKLNNNLDVKKIAEIAGKKELYFPPPLANQLPLF